MRWLLCGVLALAVVSVKCGLHEFNCNQVTTDICVNGNCNMSTGTCNCPDPFVNFDCGHDSTGDQSNTVCQCLNNGICDSSSQCVCGETHYNGANGKCELARIQHKCDMLSDGKILVNINTPSQANVNVFPPGKEATCTLTDTRTANIPADWMGKVKEISVPTDADCGTVTTQQIDGETATCVTLFIRHRDQYLTELDTKVIFCCTDSKTIPAIVGNIDSTAIGLQEKTVANTFSGDQFTAVLLDGSGIEIPDDDTKNLGDPVNMKFEVVAGADIAAIKILSCTAQNEYPSTATTVSVPFITANGCKVANSGILVTATRTNDGKTVTLETKAVLLKGSTDVYYVCNVQLCAKATECAATSCTDGSSGVGRKKREASPPPSNTTSFQTVAMFYRVKDLTDVSEVKEAIKDAVNESNNINMTAAVIGLAIVVLFLLAACLLLGICLINRRSAPLDLKTKG